MTIHWRVVLVTTAWLAMLVVGRQAGAAPHAAGCRASCRALIRHECSGSFRFCFLPKIFRKTRATVLRQCRTDGPAACQLADACDRGCDAAAAQCAAAIGASGGGSDRCNVVVFGQCEQHGTAYCASPSTTVNGCNPAAAVDRRSEPLVTVTFQPYVGYSPACVRVSIGTTVRFEGDFAAEPLVGGVAPDADPASPFAPGTSTGTAQEFVLTSAGTFGYFASDIGTPPAVPFSLPIPWGAVIVEPES